MGMYYNGKKVRNLYYNGKCLTRLALGKEMTRLVEGDDFVRAQWLVGDGSAVINTNIEDITNLTELYCYFYSNNPSNNERIFGREGNSRIVLRYVSVNNIEFFTSPNNNPPYITLGFNTEGYFYADFVANQASTSLSSPTNFIGNSDKIGNLGTIHLFGDKVAYGPTSIVSAKIKSFRAAPFVDLIPCCLLRPIPATLDGNGIARNAGECGMYDAVSGKFYGNVGSGAFTVEPSLIEGVDYERHRWLKTGSGGPVIRVVGDYNTDNDAYLETTFKGASVNGDKDIIIGFGSDDSFGYRLFVGGQAVFIDIHKRTSGVLTSKRLSFSYQPYQVCHVFVNSNRYEFNNVAGTYELGNGFDAGIRQNFTQIFTNQSNNDMHYAETKMRVNNVEYDLIPVRLLRSLPAYLDANGKARKQFECGMLDLKSMKFYGDVANTGNFTVSDN